MKQYTVSCNDILESPWRNIKNISVGDISQSVEERCPNMYYTISCDGRPYLVINVYYEYNTTFKDAEVLGKYVFIGFCDSVFIVNLDNNNVRKIMLRYYFGHMNKYENFILIGSACDLLLFDKSAELKWVAEDVGIDGVIVHDFDGKYIYGNGEYDPPGGWIKFKICYKTGKRVND
ncbi:hypothetical protein FACS1894164_13280 [Spirochaetia bacterium]|nr:hypothetical protein FACS1894164_13280 [Spirochaetia bacterium]